MQYEYKLILRILIAILLLTIPFNIFYWLLLKPTLYLSYLPLLTKYKDITIGNDYLLINNNILKFTLACIATATYYLLILLLLLTKNIGFIKLIRMLFSGILLILTFNIIRIDLLIVIYIEYGIIWFNNLHLLFWKFLSSFIVVLIWLYLCYKFKIKNIPAYSDLKFLIKKIRPLKKY